MISKLLWKPSPNFSQRTARVDKLVLHSSEGNYAGGVAWLCDPKSQVSAHFMIRADGLETTQMVAIHEKAWACCAFNSSTVSFEMEGFAAKGFSDALLDSVAEIFAFHCHYLQIPIVHAKGGVGPGICTHDDLGQAGGGHVDPWTDPAKTLAFIARVETWANKGDWPQVWMPETVAKLCRLCAPRGDDDGD